MHALCSAIAQPPWIADRHDLRRGHGTLVLSRKRRSRPFQRRCQGDSPSHRWCYKGCLTPSTPRKPTLRQSPTESAAQSPARSCQNLLFDSTSPSRPAHGREGLPVVHGLSLAKNIPVSKLKFAVENHSFWLVLSRNVEQQRTRRPEKNRRSLLPLGT